MVRGNISTGEQTGYIERASATQHGRLAWVSTWCHFSISVAFIMMILIPRVAADFSFRLPGREAGRRFPSLQDVIVSAGRIGSTSRYLVLSHRLSRECRSVDRERVVTTRVRLSNSCVTKRSSSGDGSDNMTETRVCSGCLHSAQSSASGIRWSRITTAAQAAGQLPPKNPPESIQLHRTGAERKKKKSL